jgi:hypothetical protein
VVIGFFVYLGNFESRGLAEKYGMGVYGKDQDRDWFGGFFEGSKRWRYGDYRWFGGRGEVKLKGERSKVKGREGERSKVKGERGKGQRAEDRGRRAEGGRRQNEEDWVGVLLSDTGFGGGAGCFDGFLW